MSTPSLSTPAATAADPALLAQRLALPLPAIQAMTHRHPALMQALVSAAEDPDAGIDVERLPERDRRWLWRALRRHDAGYAQLLRDPNFVAFRTAVQTHFNARLVLECEQTLSVLRAVFAAPRSAS